MQSRTAQLSTKFPSISRQNNRYPAISLSHTHTKLLLQLHRNLAAASRNYELASGYTRRESSEAAARRGGGGGYWLCAIT